MPKVSVIMYLLTSIRSIKRWFTEKFRKKLHPLKVYTTYQSQPIKAFVKVRDPEGKIIKHGRTPIIFRLKPGKYIIEATYMSQIVERDVELKGGEKALVEIKFPSGILECKAFEDNREIKATIEILNRETGELIAKRITPFSIHLEQGMYTLRATYTPSREK